MQPLDISQSRLARDIDVPVTRINNIIKHYRSITADMALHLGKYFQTAAQMWINLQSHYDLELVERDERPHIKDRIRTMATI